MLPNRPHPDLRAVASSPVTQKKVGQSNQSVPAQCTNILRSLEGLDSEEALKLLEGIDSPHPALLCRRAHLAHQCKSHRLSLLYVRQSLTAEPTCPNCITILIELQNRLQDSDQELLFTASKVLELMVFLPKLAKVCKGAIQYSEVMKRISDSGGVASHTAVCEMRDGNRKVVAAELIPRDQKVLFVPKSFMITLQMARELPLVKEIIRKRSLLKSPKHTHLAVFMLYEYEKGEESTFWPYLRILPSNFDHFPISYPQNLWSELKGSCFRDTVQQKKVDLRRDYDILVGEDPSFSRFSFARFVQIRMLVSSRVFGVVMDRVKTDAMVPLADMLNHSPPKQTTWYYCDAEEGFVIQALKPIPVGSEIFDSYGQKCNSRFLLSYGFTLLDNPHNQVTIQLSLPNLHEHGVLNTKIKISKIIDSKAFDDIMGLLRVACQRSHHNNSDEQQEQEMEMGIEALKQIPFQSVDNEIEVWGMLASIIVERLREYPTNIAEDKKLLNSGKLDPNLWNVVNLRRGEKEILIFYQTMSKRMLKYLRTRTKEEGMELYQSYTDSIKF